MNESSNQSAGPWVQSEHNIVNTIYVEGPDTDVTKKPIRGRDPWHTSSRVYEAGNSATWMDCTSGGCVSNETGGTMIIGTEIASSKPTGLVPESFTVGNAASEQAFVDLIVEHVGSRPTDRWSHTSTVLGYLSDIDGTLQGGLVDEVSTDPAGGWPTFAENSVDHTDVNDTHCGAAIPTGANKDDVMTSGLTRLHEWAISCTDSVMPPGWRPDTLELYPAP